jgi:hypothetical protein
LTFVDEQSGVNCVGMKRQSTEPVLPGPEEASVLPTSSKGFPPDQPKNPDADEKIRPHTIFSIKG